MNRRLLWSLLRILLLTLFILLCLYLTGYPT